MDNTLPNAQEGQLASDSEEKLMTVVEHLDELRSRLIRCLIALAVALGVSLYIAQDVVNWLKKPAGNISFQALSLEEPLLVYFKVAFYTALALASPYLLFELARFISPGLKRNEKHMLLPVVLGGPILFMCGVAFAYNFVLPPMLFFFGSFGQSIAPIHQRLDFYISLVSSILLYMGLCFQLPIVLFALSFTGLVSSGQLIRLWRYAIFASALAAAIITPDPTAVSMLIVMGALVGLYFLSVGLLKIFGR